MSTEPVTTATLVEDLQTVMRDAEALLKATAAQTGDKIQEVRARTEESLRQAKARLIEVQGDIVQRARIAADVAEGYVKTNPWQSVGAAALFGFVVGLLMRSRD